MQMINVQFADDSDQVVVSYLSGPQDPAYYPNQGVISTSDPRWAAYYNAKPFFLRDGLPTPTDD
jgi:hypothetical protein